MRKKTEAAHSVGIVLTKLYRISRRAHRLSLDKIITRTDFCLKSRLITYWGTKISLHTRSSVRSMALQNQKALKSPRLNNSLGFNTQRWSTGATANRRLFRVISAISRKKALLKN